MHQSRRPERCCSEVLLLTKSMWRCELDFYNCWFVAESVWSLDLRPWHWILGSCFWSHRKFLYLHICTILIFISPDCQLWSSTNSDWGRDRSRRPDMELCLCVNSAQLLALLLHMEEHWDTWWRTKVFNYLQEVISSGNNYSCQNKFPSSYKIRYVL